MELEHTTRKKIYEQIKKSPGIHFRELERRLQLVAGNLQYHLQYLEKKNQIVASNDEYYVRYFVKDKSLNETERKLISFLRRSGCRHIILQLLTNPDLNNKELSQTTDLSPSTISWNLNKLIEAGIIERKNKGRISRFAIIDPPMVAKLIIHYKESFLDTLVDDFIEIWESKNLK